MLDRVEPLYHAFRIGTGLFKNCLADIDDMLARKRLTGNTNNLIFLSCHLTDARFFMHELFGGRYDPPFPELAEIRSVDEMPDPPPPMAAVLRKWIEISDLLEPMFDELTPAHLNAPAPFRGYPADTPKTVEPLLIFLMHHEGYHIGQMAFLRKALGKPAMTYD